MQERAINLKPWEVLAFLAGRKTQIRRPVKPRYDCVVSDGDGALWPYYPSYVTGAEPERLPCPFGAVGDGLWGREAFLPCDPLCGSTSTTVGKATYVCFRDGAQKFKSTGDVFPWALPSPPTWEGYRFASSTTMPRWASRFAWTVGGVRVERVREIALADMEACYHLAGRTLESFRESFVGRDKQMAFCKEQWNRDYGAGAWERNDWVWVVDVKAK